MHLLVSNEINFVSTRRFSPKYAEVVRLIDSGVIDVKPMISGSHPMGEAVAAFNAAGDRSQSVKPKFAFTCRS